MLPEAPDEGQSQGQDPLPPPPGGNPFGADAGNPFAGNGEEGEAEEEEEEGLDESLVDLFRP